MSARSFLGQYKNGKLLPRGRYVILYVTLFPLGKQSLPLFPGMTGLIKGNIRLMAGHIRGNIKLVNRHPYLLNVTERNEAFHRGTLTIQKKKKRKLDGDLSCLAAE